MKIEIEIEPEEFIVEQLKDYYLTILELPEWYLKEDRKYYKKLRKQLLGVIEYLSVPEEHDEWLKSINP